MAEKIGPGKPDRYMQPSILMALLDGSSHGYELLQQIGEYGFLKGDAPPGMIYRHLRQMEEEGLVASQWDATGSGPAKRVYAITDEGREVLHAWVGYMERQAASLLAFVTRYREKDAG
ncbi:helix-turn-helix transcriptional regulator [Solidesulfovibrio sp.]|jgi:poly-beta-hydroxybutyrate-responsive repressor|uniref:helix-turn-helix transcriptional regulator n=1 Tax=Solidesulfovibrio sp. TaxID=2910990 RepID=UPI002B207774|nr:helix-turn-helix transcriptional regulator [Solidesulfovibrio sp.]MEA5090410.1 helix-turn-helix transcriptional regulator [Solidesulfovibrio sp.]